MLFMFFIPFLIGYILNRRLRFNYSMQWMVGLLTLSVLLMTMHGYGLSKKNTFNVIYFLSTIGLLLCINDFFKTSIYSHLVRVKRYALTLSLADFLFLIVVLLFLAEAISSIIRNPLIAGDALAYWYQKAKFLYSWEALKEFPTISYPNLGSSIWMLGMNFYDGLESRGRIFFPIMASVIFFSIWRLLRVTFKVNNKELLLLSLFFSYLFIYLMTSKFSGGFSYIYSGYLDWMVGIIPAMAYIFLLVNLFINMDDYKKNSFYKFNFKKVSFLFFIISCASIIKMEGYVLTIIYIFSYLMTLFLMDKKYIINNKLNILMVILLTLFVSTLYIQIVIYNDIDFILAQSFSLPNLDSFIYKTPLVLEYFASNVRNNFEVIFPFFVISFIAYKSKNFILLASVIMPIALYYSFMFLVYLSSTVNLEWHLHTSFERLFHQIGYMYIFGSIFILFYHFSSVSDINAKQKNF
jgi:hypothetical protein